MNFCVKEETSRNTHDPCTRDKRHAPEVDDGIPQTCPCTGKTDLWQEPCSSNEVHKIHVRVSYRIWEQKRQYFLLKWGKDFLKMAKEKGNRTKNTKGTLSRARTRVLKLKRCTPAMWTSGLFLFLKQWSHSTWRMHALLTAHCTPSAPKLW